MAKIKLSVAVQTDFIDDGNTIFLNVIDILFYESLPDNRNGFY